MEPRYSWISRRSVPDRTHSKILDFRNIENAQTLAQAIVNTIHDPLLVLDKRFYVRAARAGSARLGSEQAVSLGLIVTELVINAIKYAFPAQRPDASISVLYEVNGGDWKLTVSDNGVGKDEALPAKAGGGLGTAIVQALVKQLGAQIVTTGGQAGTVVVITWATFTSRLTAVASVSY